MNNSNKIIHRILRIITVTFLTRLHESFKCTFVNNVKRYGNWKQYLTSFSFSFWRFQTHTIFFFFWMCVFLFNNLFFNRWVTCEKLIDFFINCFRLKAFFICIFESLIKLKEENITVLKWRNQLMMPIIPK